MGTSQCPARLRPACGHAVPGRRDREARPNAHRRVSRRFLLDDLQRFVPNVLPGGQLIEDISIELGARWLRGTLDRVEHARRRAVTRDGDRLAYEMLVLALGARPGRQWNSPDVLTFHGGHDGPDYELLLRRLDEGRVKRVAFVQPAGPSITSRWIRPTERETAR